MKNLLIFIQISILTLFLSQTPKTDIKADRFVKSTTKDSILIILNDNAQQLEEVKVLKLENDQSLLKLKELQIEKRQLFKSNLKLVDELINKKIRKNEKIIYIRNEKTSDYKLDSICVSYNRNSIFGLKKCDKWEYFKYTMIKEDY